MVREVRSTVLNHQAGSLYYSSLGLILREAAKTPLLKDEETG
jgi:hypothetical protein